VQQLLLCNCSNCCYLLQCNDCSSSTGKLALLFDSAACNVLRSNKQLSVRGCGGRHGHLLGKWEVTRQPTLRATEHWFIGHLTKFFNKSAQLRAKWKPDFVTMNWNENGRKQSWRIRDSALLWRKWEKAWQLQVTSADISVVIPTRHTPVKR